MGEVLAKDIDEFFKHLWIAEVEIDLVAAECAPNLAVSISGLHCREKRRVSWPNDSAVVAAGLGLNKVIFARVDTLAKKF